MVYRPNDRAKAETGHRNLTSQSTVTVDRLLFSSPVNGADGIGNFPAQFSDSFTQSGYGTVSRFVFGIACNAGLFDDGHLLICAIQNRSAREQLAVAFAVSLETQHLDLDVVTRPVSRRPRVNDDEIRVQEQRQIFR